MDASRQEPEFERLLMHASWLAHLARRLVSDPASADDLVQDTWHAALRSPDRRVRADRGWLATVLANLARTRARSEGARRRRERSVAAAEAIDGPDRLVERAEAQRKLLAVVLELDEPYRSTVLERYAQGVTSAEIARRAHLKESTVRTRLARAHEQLRARLERGGGGLAALAPILSESHSTTLVAAGGTQATKVAFGSGAGIMGLALKIGVVAAVGLCGWSAWLACAPRAEQVAWSEPEPAARASEFLDATDASRSTRISLAANESVATEPPREVQAAPSNPDKPEQARQWLGITVVRDLVPTSGVRVWLADPETWRMPECLDVRARAPEGAKWLDTNSLGMAVFSDLDPKAYNFRIGIGTGRDPSAPDRFITTEVFPGFQHEVRLGSVRVSGRVYDPLGHERVGAGVQVYTTAPGAQQFYIAAHARVDERGEYQIGDLAAGEYLVIMEVDGTFDGLGVVEGVPVVLRQGEERSLDFGAPVPAPRWTGRVLNALQEPFHGGRLQLVNERDGRQLIGDIDGEGRFDMAVTAGTWKVLARVEGSPSGGFELGSREFYGRDVTSDLVVPGARLVIRLIEPEVAIEAPETRPRPKTPSVAVRAEGHDYPAAFRDARRLPDGRIVVDGLEPGVWTVGVFPGSFEEGKTVNVTIGPDQSLVDLELHWKGP